VRVRPHIGATLAAGSACKPRFDIGQPKIIGPVVASDGDRMAAAIVGTVNQPTADAAFAQFGECDFLRAIGYS
jgi:hypothetical protein